MIRAVTENGKRCGSCKWLDVPPQDIRKDGHVKERYRFRVYRCTVPFEDPKYPASFTTAPFFQPPSRNMMCPYYGLDCDFHETRTK